MPPAPRASSPFHGIVLDDRVSLTVPLGDGLHLRLPPEEGCRIMVNQPLSTVGRPAIASAPSTTSIPTRSAAVLPDGAADVRAMMAGA